jgi:hypothetical protein
MTHQGQAVFKIMTVCALSAALLAACGVRRGSRDGDTPPAVTHSDPALDEIEQSLQRLQEDVDNMDTLDDLDDL